MNSFLNIVRRILSNDLGSYILNCPPDITDRVFVIIQNKYIDKYNNTVRINGKNITNRGIGRFIRKYWRLQNLGKRKAIHSKLIKTYTEHSN